MLERINLDDRARRVLSLVGASGCGKTTFLRILLGQEQPTRGTILRRARRCRTSRAGRGIVFQRYSVFPHLTAIQNLLLVAELRRARRWLPGSARRAPARSSEADAMLARVGLGACPRLYPAALSGGMQQRLAIAQALIGRRKVLLPRRAVRRARSRHPGRHARAGHRDLERRPA